MRKGISPLLGALILVAIVIAVTSIVAPAVLDFVEDETGRAAERSNKRVDCNRAGISIRNMTCVENNSLYELSVKVRNTGYQDLTGFRLEARESDGYQTYTFDRSNETLRADDTMVFMNTSFNYPVQRARFISETCPATASRDIAGDDFPC